MKDLINPLGGFAACLLLALVVAGCGKGTKLSSEDQKAFATAAPEVKQSWMLAQAAAGTNDLVLAITTLRSLLGQNLTVEQVEAAQNAVRTYSTKLMTDASHGDIEAQRKLEALRAVGGRRGQ